MREYSNSPEINGIVRLGCPASMETQKDEALVDSWVDSCYRIMKRGGLIYAYANNHFQGHGPATTLGREWFWKDGHARAN
jgi:hypothetical protein